MAEVTIRFRHDPRTGQRELIIGYESDDDALPHEHERDHRALAERLLGVPLGDDTVVKVERVSEQKATSDARTEREGAAREAAATKR